MKAKLQELRELRLERLQSTLTVAVDNTATTPLREKAALSTVFKESHRKSFNYFRDIPRWG